MAAAYVMVELALVAVGATILQSTGKGAVLNNDTKLTRLPRLAITHNFRNDITTSATAEHEELHSNPLLCGIAFRLRSVGRIARADDKAGLSERHRGNMD